MNDSNDEKDPLVQYIDKPHANSDSLKLSDTLCNPHKRFYRYFALVFMCFLGFGSYFCYDNPAALEDNFKRDLKMTTASYNLFYSLYSWPNVFLCFIGGYLIDRFFGIRLGAIIFSFIILCGQLIFGVGALLNKIWLMNLGRFIFGIGGESLAVAQNTYAVTWFLGRELNFVFGIQLSVSRLGSTVNMLVMTPIYNSLSEYTQGYECLGWTLLVAACTCLFSFGCALVLMILDRRRVKCIPSGEQVQAGDEIKLKDMLHFPLSLWLLFIICVAYYCAIFPFISLGKGYFISKYNFEPTLANTANSMVYLISAGASPIFGFLVDLFGLNTYWVMGAIVATLGAHALLAFTFINPFVSMILMGCSYSALAASLWPMVALIVQKKELGTAYGLMQSVQNLGLAVIPLITGQIVDNAGYFVLEVFFLALLCIALIASIILLFYDRLKSGLLGVSQNERRARQEISSIQ